MLAACQERTQRKIQLSVGNKPEQAVEFAPTVSLAQYVEAPGSGSELTLTFANYPASCDSFVAPGPNQVLLTVVVMSPKAPLSPAAYPWAGHTAHGGTVERPLRAYALPTVRLASHAYRIEPGGALGLEALNLRPGGEVRGLLGFDFPGNATTEASRISGPFTARICRFSADSSHPGTQP
jgi:hypothetical protein